MYPERWPWLRLGDGLCVAGVFICVESGLNDRAEPATRGTILAWYMVALYSGQALGQLILRSGNTAPQIPFELASVLISLAIIPVFLTRATSPTLDDAASLPPRRLFDAAPPGSAGAGTPGLRPGALSGPAATL